MNEWLQAHVIFLFKKQWRLNVKITTPCHNYMCMYLDAQTGTNVIVMWGEKSDKKIRKSLDKQVKKKKVY